MFNTNGDLVTAARVTYPQMYYDCAAKVQSNINWRKRYGG